MNYKSLIVFGIIALMAISSCKKDSSGNVIIPKMTATIDGSSWTSFSRVSVLTGDVFTITGTALNGTSLTGAVLMVVINGSTTGTYTVSGSSKLCSCTYKGSYDAAALDWFQSLSGTLTLTKVDKVSKLISGTFQFTLTKLTAQKIVSNGVFTDLSYSIVTN